MSNQYVPVVKLTLNNTISRFNTLSSSHLKVEMNLTPKGTPTQIKQLGNNWNELFNFPSGISMAATSGLWQTVFLTDDCVAKNSISKETLGLSALPLPKKGLNRSSTKKMTLFTSLATITIRFATNQRMYYKKN